MGSSFTCKLNPCCGDRRNCNPPRQYYGEPEKTRHVAPQPLPATNRATEPVVKALRIGQSYVLNAMRNDGGIENCEIGYRTDFEVMQAGLAAALSVPAPCTGGADTSQDNGEATVSDGTQFAIAPKLTDRPSGEAGLLRPYEGSSPSLPALIGPLEASRDLLDAFDRDFRTVGYRSDMWECLRSALAADLPVWHVGSWGDGSTPPHLANIFCDAHEATIATGIDWVKADDIVTAHNEALAALSSSTPVGEGKLP